VIAPADFFAMRSERVIQVVVFVVFFGIGAAALSATVLCDEILEYFHNRGLLKQAEANLRKLESLDADYDALLHQLNGDPCQVARLAPATLGIGPNDPNTVYPRATIDKLAAARRALSEEPNEPTDAQATPSWLNLCCRWPRRHILFFCGAALVLISFVFFGPTKRPPRSIEITSSNPEPTHPPETQ
jgi:ABC-type Fe3+-siderophore transport system permease subunit